MQIKKKVVIIENLLDNVMFVGKNNENICFSFANINQKSCKVDFITPVLSIFCSVVWYYKL